jgi:signal transduction histidine kinase
VVPLSPGWASGEGVPLTATLQLALVTLLFAIFGRVSTEGTANLRAACGWREEQLVEQNADLPCQIDESQHRSVEINDMVLRRVGVELHDGPAQLISFALLRLDGLRPDGTMLNQDPALGDLERIRGALQEALAEIRSMAAGLTLPELSCVSPGDVLCLAVRNHERRTATSVACDVKGLPPQVPAAVKSCLYRFAQEGLNNAYRHAGGRRQALRAKYRANTIEVEVEDAGPGFEPESKIGGGRLGLLGMRERITSLGGTLEIESRPGSGTRLTARFKVAQCGAREG